MKIDHIGYAVESIEKAQQRFMTLGYTFEPKIRDKARGVFLCFGSMDGYRIELVAPAGGATPVDNVLSRIGPTPYHICYKSDNIEAEIARLQKEHFKVTVPLAPAIAFDGRRVVFMFSLAIGLIEIVEERE